MLHTRFTEMFGVSHPVMSAPVGMHSGGRLAGAVTAAGGLGSFGGTHPFKGPEWIEAEIAAVRSLKGHLSSGSSRPSFRCSSPVRRCPEFRHTTDGCRAFLRRSPAVARPGEADGRHHHVSGPIIRRRSQDDRRRRRRPRLQGTEAGGHTGTMSLLPFLSAAAARWPDVPLLAAGVSPTAGRLRRCLRRAPTVPGSAPPSWPPQRPSRSTTSTRSS